MIGPGERLRTRMREIRAQLEVMKDEVEAIAESLYACNKPGRIEAGRASDALAAALVEVEEAGVELNKVGP